MKQLNLVLEPLKFMGFSLEQTTQGCVFANLGACVAKLPAAERFAVHKLIVFGERPASERVKAAKDLLQAASLASWFLNNGQADVFNAVRCARPRPRMACPRAAGKRALLRMAPDVAGAALWSA